MINKNVTHCLSLVKHSIQYITIGFVLSGTQNAYSDYTANAIGTVTQVWTYGTNAAIRIDPMPATGCQNNDFFYITSAEFTDVANRNFAHSISMAALLSAKKVNVGYDKDGTGCYATRPVLYRIDLMP